MTEETPEVDELVLAVIKKIMPYGAFLVLPEFKDKEAFLHVSEVAPRWIKNIHEFISEGEKHVVKVYRIDNEKNQIDVSLKRVSAQEKQMKLESVKQKTRSEKLLSIAAQKAKVDASLMQSEIEKDFDDVYACLEICSEEGIDALKNPKLPKAFKIELVELAKKNIKKSEVSVNGLLSISCYEADGIERIKKVLQVEGAGVHYLGAPNYRISVVDENYKSGEKRLTKIVNSIVEAGSKNKCEVEFKGIQK